MGANNQDGRILHLAQAEREMGGTWGAIPACPGSSSQATKQQSRTSALMVTAKRAPLPGASIYRAGAAGWGWGVQSLGQLGGHDGEAAQPLEAMPAVRP